MFEDTKTDQIISQLTRLTAEGKLKWTRTQPGRSLSGGTDSRFPFYCEAKYNDRLLAVVQERYEYFVPDTESFRWGEAIKLLMLDQDHQLMYTFPPSSGLSDLVDAVQEQLANIDDVFADLLPPKRRKINE